MTDFLDTLGVELRRAAEAPAPRRPQSNGARERRYALDRRRRTPRVRGRVRPLIIATGIVIGMTSAALAATNVLTPNTAPPGAGRVPSGSVEPSVLAAFAILRRPATGDDRVPAADHVTFSGASGANIQLARRAHGLQGGSAWVVPGRGNICIITSSATDKEQGGAGCTENAAAIAGKLWLHGSTRSAPGVELVAGLVPDDVHNVTLHLTNGETQAIPVHENMYLIEVHGSVASVATKASGSSHGA